MKSKCVTGKNCYESEQLALEALVQFHIRRNYKQGQGPVNVYSCSDCGEWHFTSKGALSPVLSNEETIEWIRRAKRAMDWEEKFR